MRDASDSRGIATLHSWLRVAAMRARGDRPRTVDAARQETRRNERVPLRLYPIARRMRETFSL